MSKIYNIKYLRGKECVFFVGLFMAFLILLPFNNARCEDTDEADRGEVSAPQTVKEELREGEKAEEKGEKKEVIKILSPYLGNINITGGVSGGWFATTNEGAGGKKDNFVLTNLLIDLSSEMENGLFGFNAGLGGVTTPSVFDSPDDAIPDFRIQYAAMNLRPIKSLPGLAFQGGLLQPNSGYECTYTFNNRNITVGAIASQQPYNAAGARATYAFSEDFRIWSGIFKHRLARDEYETEYVNEHGNVPSKNVQDSYSWEAGMNDNIGGVGLSLYHYHLTGLRHLTGVAAEYTMNNLYMALNVDYWRWSSEMDRYFEDSSSIGAALYIAPSFKKFSLPLRLEYIQQGKSRIYLPNQDAENIYAAALTPTYNFTDNILIRTEASYVHADNGFSTSKGKPKDDKFLFSLEVVVKF